MFHADRVLRADIQLDVKVIYIFTSINRLYMKATLFYVPKHQSNTFKRLLVAIGLCYEACSNLLGSGHHAWSAVDDRGHILQSLLDLRAYDSASDLPLTI